MLVCFLSFILIYYHLSVCGDKEPIEATDRIKEDDIVTVPEKAPFDNDKGLKFTNKKTTTVTVDLKKVFV